MMFNGGQICRANWRRRRIADWARSALALAMALFVVAHTAALHAQGARHTASLFNQTCASAQPASDGAPAHTPATSAEHDCAACVTCVFSSVVDARIDFHIAPSTSHETIASFVESEATPAFRWRAAHPARAPPHLS